MAICFSELRFLLITLGVRHEIGRSVVSLFTVWIDNVVKILQINGLGCNILFVLVCILNADDIAFTSYRVITENGYCLWARIGVTWYGTECQEISEFVFGLDQDLMSIVSPALVTISAIHQSLSVMGRYTSAVYLVTCTNFKSCFDNVTVL
jgi:hypothetical protein